MLKWKEKNLGPICIKVFFLLVGNIRDLGMGSPAFLYIYKFIYFRLRWVFIAACGHSLVAASGGYSLLRCVGFSLRWLFLLWSMGSRCAGLSSCGMWALERRLSSCGARA